MLQRSQLLHLIACALVFGSWQELSPTPCDLATFFSTPRLTEGSRKGADAAADVQAPVLFRDVTRQSGITFQHITSPTPEKHMPETMGSGVVFFDFNDDGYVDLFLVNSGSLLSRDSA